MMARTRSISLGPVHIVRCVSLLSNHLCCEMSLPELAAQCLRELGNYRRGEPCTDTYVLELLRRATIQDKQEAWTWVQHCFGGMVRGWLRRHPQREVACRLESEENYVAQTFERFCPQIQAPLLFIQFVPQDLVLLLGRHSFTLSYFPAFWKLFADEPLAGAACSCFLREESKDTGTPPIQDRHSQVKQALIPFRTCFHPQTRQVLMGFGGRHSQKHL